MGRVEGSTWEEVSNCQNIWKNLPEDVCNPHGTKRRCGDLLQMIDQT